MSLADIWASLFPTPTMPLTAPPTITAPGAPASYEPAASDNLGAILHAVAPHLSAPALAEWTSALAPWLRKYSVTTAETLAMFFGQCSYESVGFSVMQENLRYTTASRICAVWPSRFPTIASATPCVNNPEALADKVYQGRMGNTLAGDGWRFRGEGLIELTGRQMDGLFGQSIGKSAEDTAAYMLTTAGAAQSAVWFWDYRHLNAPAQAWDIEACTKLINGGTDGLAQRVGLCTAALSAAKGLHLN